METNKTTLPVETFRFIFADGTEMVVPLKPALKFNIVSETYVEGEEDPLVLPEKVTRKILDAAVRYAEFDIQMEEVEGIKLKFPRPVPATPSFMYPMQLDMMKEFSSYRSREELVKAADYLDYPVFLEFASVLIVYSIRNKTKEQVQEMAGKHYTPEEDIQRQQELKKLIENARESESTKQAQQEYKLK